MIGKALDRDGGDRSGHKGMSAARIVGSISTRVPVPATIGVVAPVPDRGPNTPATARWVMQAQYTLGGQATPAGPRPRSKPERSGLILTGTAAITTSVLLAWLIVFRFLGTPGVSRIIARAFGPPEAAVRAVLLLGEDCRRLGGGGDTASEGWRPFAEEIRGLVGRKGDEPVVAYVSAIGISTPGGAFLLPADGTPASRSSMVPLEDFLDLYKGGPGPRLLILDALQVDADRDLGVFGNAFVDRLKDLMQKGKYAKLAVLCSCDSGQASWTSEADGRSAFGYFVAEGLARKGGVRDLVSYVRPRVARWARLNRGAIQTPMLIGDDRRDFRLPRLTLARPERGGGLPRAIPDGLVGRWEERDRLGARRPYRHAPRAWRQYQDALLHAEALIRGGDEARAKGASAAADDLARVVEAHASDTPPARPRSLGMLVRGLAGGADADAVAGRARAEGYRRAIEEALAGTGGPREKPTGAVSAGTRLGEDDLGRTPTFVEGQVPLWFAEFARRGGASDPDLRDRRLDLLRQAVAVRFKAETVAAADDRIARFLRGPVDNADARRRLAQDYAFAADEAGLARGAGLLTGCAEAYDQAAGDASRWGGAADVVQRAGAELPYYGEWMARRGAGLDPGFEGLLEQAAELTGLLDGAEAPPARLKELSAAVVAGLERLADDVGSRGRRLAGEEGPAPWREVDALLKVPMLPAAMRKGLLDRLAAAGPGRLAADSGGDEPGSNGDEGPDPIVRDRALGLARLELGLLKLGGLNVSDLPEILEAARSASKEDASRADESLDAFADRVRVLRAAAIRAVGEQPEGSDLADEEIRRTRAAADRVARILPSPDLGRLAADPAEAMDRFHRSALLLWHGRRLIADGATKHARLLLDDAMETIKGRTPALKEAYAEANRLDDAGLLVEGEGPGGWNGGQRTVRVAVQGRGELPQGHAAFLFTHDPAFPLKVDDLVSKPGAGEGTLIALPLSGRVTRKLKVAQVGSAPKKGATAIDPLVFYRGRYFAPPEGSRDRPSGDLIEIRIVQQKQYTKKIKGKTITYSDQFEHQQVRAALHPFHNLDYKLVIRNKTDERLKLFVTHGLTGDQATEVVELGPKGVTDLVTGRVWAHDFPDEKLRDLEIAATEGEKDGSPACKPMKVAFRKVHPKEFIVAAPGYQGNIFHVTVTHMPNDPVPVPVEVLVTVGPGSAFKETSPALKEIEPNSRATFGFRILKPVTRITYFVTAEGVKDVVTGHFIMDEAPPGKDLKDAKDEEEGPKTYPIPNDAAKPSGGL